MAENTPERAPMSPAHRSVSADDGRRIWITPANPTPTMSACNAGGWRRPASMAAAITNTAIHTDEV